MKPFLIRAVFLLSLLLSATPFTIRAQQTGQDSTEILSNAEIILMTKTNLGKPLIINKIRESKSAFDVSVNGLINLKTAGVDDEIIGAMMEKSRALREKISAETTSPVSAAKQPSIESVPTIVLNSADVLRSAKTVAIEKSTVNPSRQALEKELLKRSDWQKLNLNIVRYREGADLRIEIGFVPLSVITHRYVFRIYDNRSGTIVAAGETTSWGSLAKNLAREISKKLLQAR
jgi:hypothetical protein